MWKVLLILALPILFRKSREMITDAEILARMLVMETGMGLTPKEIAGVAWCAINRMKRKGGTLYDIIVSPSWVGTGPRADSYVGALTSKERGYKGPLGHRNPEDSSVFMNAIAFAGKVIAGLVENPIGKREGYLHLRGMPTDNPENRAKYAKEIQSGKRIVDSGKILPKWAVDVSRGGTAHVLEIGITRFV